MITGFILSQAFSLGFLFTGFKVQDQGSIGSCSTHAISHCLNLEAGWNATHGADLWKMGKLGGYGFNDITGAENRKIVEFTQSITGVKMERIPLSFIQSGSDWILSEGTKNDIRGLFSSGKHLFLTADLDWKGSFGTIQRNGSGLTSHAVCGYTTTTGGIMFVNSWGWWHWNAVGLIEWDSLKYSELYSIDWTTPPEKPKPKWMIIREQQKQKTLQKQSKKIQ